ncbi:MAG: hypothetical protein IJC59_04380 [Lachnospiraceae bacterium]|nr:hypothetical protein [Lachnospiraceae bacterium]
MKQSFSDKMERKLGKYAIQNLSLYLIICYGFGYIIQMVNADFFGYLILEPALILRGQIWRLITWILVPPSSGNLFLVLIMLYFYYSLGTSLERVWGTYRYNLYIFSGMLFTILGMFVLYVILYMRYGMPVTGIGYVASTYYINMSIFLAFSVTFPDMQVLLMFVIPIKVKVLGIIYAIMLVIEAMGTRMEGRIVILASLLNFIVFFLTSRKKIHMSPKQFHRRQVYKQQVQKTQAVAKHKCAVCGRTSITHPELEFRFCSKCEGNYEYCQEHLFTHEHIRYDGSHKG